MRYTHYVGARKATCVVVYDRRAANESPSEKKSQIFNLAIWFEAFAVVAISCH